MIDVVPDDAQLREETLISDQVYRGAFLDVRRDQIRLPDGGVVRFDLEAFARHCLLNGVDQLGFLLQQQADIAAYEQRTEEAA